MPNMSSSGTAIPLSNPPTPPLGAAWAKPLRKLSHDVLQPGRRIAGSPQGGKSYGFSCSVRRRMQTTSAMSPTPEREHDQPVESQGDPGGGRHAGQRGQQRLVDRVDRLAARGADARLFLEAAALLDRVGQLAERVGQLEAAGVELEPLDDAGIPGFGRASAASGAGQSNTNVGPAAASRGSIRSRNT